ncbi:MAG: hypothetical protein H0T93_09935 [Chloroflexia bacterium]|nr:hypothetical protein [Chloroflexia bacterium]
MNRAQVDITIVGLGPGAVGRQTVAVQQVLDEAGQVFARTHDGIDFGDLLSRGNVTDVLTLRDPRAVSGGRWAAATHAICDATARGPVVLAIPGHPRFGEMLVTETIEAARHRGLSVRVLDGISVLDLVSTSLGVDPIAESVQLFDARKIAVLAAERPFAGGRFTGSPRRPMLFTHAYDATICRGLHQILGGVFPAQHSLTRIEAAGMPGERISEHPLADLGALGGNVVVFWIPAMDDLEAGTDPRTMQRITARLRQPDGCPWDRKQTRESLRKPMIDELYEVVDAIDRGDPAHLAEELGDLFLLILMQAQIAHEANEFSIEDVYRGIATKIVGRHPHVFGDAVVDTEADLSGVWAEAKAKEKAVTGDRGGKDIDGQPFAMPALERASRVLKTRPVAVDDETPELLRLVSEIVARGEDPETVLRQQLRDYVERHS